MASDIEIIHCDFDNQAHCEALVDLMEEYIADKMGGGPPYSKESKELLISGLREHPSKIVLLAVSGGNYIGLLNGYINFSTFAVRPFINVHDIIVTGSWRNKHVGKKLLEKVIVEAKKINCSKITLEVRVDNFNARHLYSKMGFKDMEPPQLFWAKHL